MKSKILFLILMAALTAATVTFTACTDDGKSDIENPDDSNGDNNDDEDNNGDDVDVPEPIPAGTVFVAGCGYNGNGTTDYSTAILWRDGVAQNLINEEIGVLSKSNYYSGPGYSAEKVFVSGNDVYVLGHGPSTPAGYTGIWHGGILWKNGKVLQTYPFSSTGTGDFSLNDIFVSGKDIYIAGTYRRDRYNCGTWIQKNGEEIFTLGGESSNVRKLFVSGNDVYAAGVAHTYVYDEIEKQQRSSSKSVLWKNGVDQKIPNYGEGNPYVSLIRSIFVAGNDVYLAADTYNSSSQAVATYWKNGAPRELPIGGPEFARAIFVSGCDVYVAGTEDTWPATPVRVWKNGEEYCNWGPIGSNQVITSLFVSGNDVYGTVTCFSNDAPAVFWKNGVAQNLPGGGTVATYINSVFVSGVDIESVGSGNCGDDEPQILLGNVKFRNPLGVDVSVTLNGVTEYVPAGRECTFTNLPYGTYTCTGSYKDCGGYGPSCEGYLTFSYTVVVDRYMIEVQV